MDTRTGEILTPERVRELYEQMGKTEFHQWIKPMEIPPTPKQLRRHPARVGRNDPCPCGSGLKFKKCCWRGK